jgi:hypothetical protein
LAIEADDKNTLGECKKEADYLLGKYPFHRIAHTVVIPVLFVFGEEVEALMHMRILSEMPESIDFESFANLIILAADDGPAQTDSINLLTSLKDKVGQKIYGDFIAEAEKLISAQALSFDLSKIVRFR